MGALNGKTALVTGSAAGIGRAVATRLLREGARVVFADREFEAVREAAEHLGEDARAVTMDVSDEAQVEQAFLALVRNGWAPDVVVANAGVQLLGHDARVADLDLDVWRRTVDINLTGTMLTLKHAVRTMLTTGGGSIILTGSPTGVNGSGGDFTAYSASKAGMHGLGRTVAATYARHGIRVNTVVPGYTETQLTQRIANDPELRQSIIDRIPLGRPGTPEDVEGIMVFLASDASSFATGGIFTVDGGTTL